MIYDYQKDSKPLSFRVSKDDHEAYKNLSSMKKKEINYLFQKWIKRVIYNNNQKNI